MQLNISRFQYKRVSFGNNQPAGPTPEQIQERKDKAAVLNTAIAQAIPGARIYYSPQYVSPKVYADGAYVVSPPLTQPWGLGTSPEVRELLLSQGAKYDQRTGFMIDGIPVQFSQILRPTIF